MTNVASSLRSNNTIQLWENIRKLCSKSNTPAVSMDNTQGRSDIASLFRDKYAKLYSSVPTSTGDLHYLTNYVEKEITSRCFTKRCYHDHHIRVQDVKLAIDQLKSGKHGGHKCFFTDHLIHGNDRLHVMLSLLLSNMITHNIVPDDLESVLIPIPKDKRKSLNDSKNYRAIAMGSILLKLLDLCILNRHKHTLNTSDLQFGFKKDHSTNQCSFVVREVIQYYNNKNTDVHVMLLDASQAFDRVQYATLFKLLCNRGLCPVVTRLLLNLYTHQIMCVNWINTLSEPFTIKNGVKQGGVLSPTLFAIYVDGLFQHFTQQRLGCHIGCTFTGALGYADDIILLAPSKNALNSMLDIANKFAETNSIIFNASKCKYLIMGKSSVEQNSILFNNVNIQSSKWERHLGNLLDSCRSDKYVTDAVHTMYSRFNSLMFKFHSATSELKYFLFKTYCMALYGCQLWNFDSSITEKVYIAWRKCCRRLLQVSNRTHSNLIHLLCADVDIDVQLHRRQLKFLQNCQSSPNSIVRLCYNLVLRGSKSDVSCSLNYLSSQYSLDKYQLYCYNRMECFKVPSEQDIAIAGTINDFIEMRDCALLPDCDKNNISHIIDFLSSS